MNRVLGFSAIAIGALVSACSTGRIEVSATASDDAALRASAGAAGSLLVTVTEVAVHIGGGDDGDDGEAGKIDDSDFVTVFEGSERLNLSDLTATNEFLGGATVPAGKVTQIRLILADDAVLDDGTNAVPVSCSSCGETGLKLNPSAKLEVPAGETLSVALDFDVNASLTPDAAGGFRLNPVVKITGEITEVPAE